MKNKVEKFLKSKGINIDYAKGIDLLQELGQKKYNLVELMEQFCQYDVSGNEAIIANLKTRIMVLEAEIKIRAIENKKDGEVALPSDGDIKWSKPFLKNGKWYKELI